MKDSARHFISKEELENWTQTYARPAASFQDNLDSWLIFKLESERFALPSLALDEIIRIPHGHVLPKALSHTIGLIQLRQETLILWDLAAILGVRQNRCLPHPDHRAIVLQNDQGMRNAFLVDRIEYQTDLKRETFQQQEQDASLFSSPLTPMVTELDDHPLGILSVPALWSAIQSQLQNYRNRHHDQ
ncbi:chemotaxis protein CheW [Magnetococcales bacterium HHB-1]